MAALASDPRVGAWIDDVIARHTRAFTRRELLKAVRALSARYVERRAELPRRSVLDSAGKRAAFAAFYAPLHLLTTLAIAERLDAASHAANRLVDFGCGTGVASAAWALAQQSPASIVGLDLDTWAIAEARRTWDTLGLAGRARRGDLVTGVDHERPAESRGSLLIFGWALNEIDAWVRRRVLAALQRQLADGAGVLIIEPIARSASPWWDDWATGLADTGARADEWRFDVRLPDPLADLDEAAGFRRDGLSARSLFRASERVP